MIKRSGWNYVDIILLPWFYKINHCPQRGKLIQNSFLLEIFLENTVNKNTWMCFTFAYFVKYILQNYRAYSFCGTIEYMAPEVVEGGSSGHDFVSTFLFYLYSTVDWWTFISAHPVFINLECNTPHRVVFC